ncbi:hypothetical protein [Vibrio campbellii]|uniref:hypothetical protein n=1 Tax=Vibrio campbellii TaxID=680 RepID=UPI001F3A2836|nr:hypothetical protein [Vibrio campbellii]MCE7729344.1 hypothetical protein [Vibrio campbellii]
MSENNYKQLSDWLFHYFCLQGISITKDELVVRLSSIHHIDDISDIDSNIEDPLWAVVPQLLMSMFDLDAFKAFKTSHTVDKSFVFVHPLNLDVIERLKNELSSIVTIRYEVDVKLTEKVASTLYGGYKWYDAYSKACQHLDSFGKMGRLLVLENMDRHKIQAIIAYKNQNRDKIAPKIVLNKQLLNAEMNGIINAFHSPDAIENVRQMLGLGLISLKEVHNE